MSYMSPVRSVCGRDQVFWSAKSVLNCSLLKLLIAGFGSKVTLLSRVLDCWFLAVWRLPWSLDRPPKRALIASFNFDLDHKRFYTGHINTMLYIHRLRMNVWVNPYHLGSSSGSVYINGLTMERSSSTKIIWTKSSWLIELSYDFKKSILFTY